MPPDICARFTCDACAHHQIIMKNQKKFKDMNKKKMYVQPQVAAVKIDGCMPLATSPEGGGSTEGVENGGGPEGEVGQSRKFESLLPFDE